MGRHPSYPEPWLTLAERLGSAQALADALGATPRVVYEWAHQRRNPSGTARKAIAELFRLHELPAPGSEYLGNRNLA